MEEEHGWKKFKSIRLDKKRFAKRVKRAEGATQRHAHRFIIRRIDNVRLVSREITIWLLLVSAMIAGLGAQLLWVQSDYMATSSRTGGTYVEGSLGQIDTMNPLYVSTNAEASVGRLVFSSLYNYDETGYIHQDLAKSMWNDQLGRD